MPRLTVEVDHAHEHEEAQRRMRAFITGLLVQFGGTVSDVEQAWTGTTLDYSFRLYGAKLDGSVFVEPRSVRCELKFPLAAMAFKGKAEDAIRSELTRVLE